RSAPRSLAPAWTGSSTSSRTGRSGSGRGTSPGTASGWRFRAHSSGRTPPSRSSRSLWWATACRARRTPSVAASRPSTGPAGRLAVVGRAPLVLLDGAHNAAGIEALLGELPRIVGGRPLDLVFAVMADKDRLAMLAPLLRSVRRAILTRVGRRGASPDDVAAA